MTYNILIVEDDELNRLVYQLFLKNTNYLLDFAENGQEGVDKYRLKRYNAVILDMRLPIIMGYEVARLMRLNDTTNHNGCHVPIIVVTADGTIETKTKALGAGINEYCQKPVDMGELIALLDFYLTKYPLIKQRA